MSDNPERNRTRLGLEVSGSDAQISEFMQQVMSAAEIHDVSAAFVFNLETDRASVTEGLHEDLPNLNSRLIDSTVLPDGRQIPTVTAKTYRRFLSDRSPDAQPSMGAWYTIGRVLFPAPSRIRFDRSRHSCRLSTAQAEYFGDFVVGDRRTEVTYLFAERFKELIDRLEQANRLSHIPNLGKKGIQNLQDYNLKLFGGDSAGDVIQLAPRL